MPNKTKKKQPCRTCNQESKKMFNDEIFQSRVKVSDYRVIHKHLPELKDGKCKESSPNDANKTLNLDLGTKYKSRCLFYFAAKSKPHGQCDKINHPDYAYGDYTNTGVAKVDSKGIATIKYRCPQAYREKGFTYIPHLHFVLSEPNCEKWGNAIYTHHIFCPITKHDWNRGKYLNGRLGFITLFYSYIFVPTVRMNYSKSFSILFHFSCFSDILS